MGNVYLALTILTSVTSFVVSLPLPDDLPCQMLEYPNSSHIEYVN